MIIRTDKAKNSYIEMNNGIIIETNFGTEISANGVTIKRSAPFITFKNLKIHVSETKELTQVIDNSGESVIIEIPDAESLDNLLKALCKIEDFLRNKKEESL